MNPLDEDKRDTRLQAIALQSAQIKEMAATPGYHIFTELLKDKVARLQAKWAKAKSPEECWNLKLQAEPWQEVLDLVTRQILIGENIADLLKKKQEEIESQD